MDDVTAFVLAGGQSQRMGADKALLDWHGRPLLAHAMDQARSLTAEIRIVGPRDRLARYGEVITDIYPEHGPLGGIHAALTAGATDLNLVLAVDMPFVAPRFLQHLLSQARAGSPWVTVPRLKDGWQPLCAVYRRGFAQIAEAALRGDENKLDALFSRVEVRIVDEEEVQRLGFGPEMFDNLNTREQLERARARQVRQT